MFDIGIPKSQSGTKLPVTFVKTASSYWRQGDYVTVSLYIIKKAKVVWLATLAVTTNKTQDAATCV